MSSKTSNVLSFFDTESVSESGAWLHFVHPKNKRPVYLDKDKTMPMRMKFKGPDSDEWTSFSRKVRDGKLKASSDQHDEKMRDSKLYVKMLLEWENVPGPDGEPITAHVKDIDKDYAFKLFFDHKDLREQALMFIISKENFTELLPEN